MAEVIKLKDKKTDMVVKAKKGSKGFYDFYCPCGSEMWNNLSKKAKGKINKKAPDLKCMDEDCPHKEGEHSYGMWLSDEHKKSLGFDTGGSRRGGGGGRGDSYGNNVPPSMYAKWAGEFAIVIAQKDKEVKTIEDITDLFEEALYLTGKKLEKYIATLEKKTQNVKEVNDDDDLGIDTEPEDFDEDGGETKVEDSDEEETADKEVEDDDIDLGELDDLGI